MGHLGGARTDTDTSDEITDMDTDKDADKRNNTRTELWTESMGSLHAYTYTYEQRAWGWRRNGWGG